MTQDAELETMLRAEAVRCGIQVRPIVMETPWRIGTVTAYLFADDPVTLIDAGYDSSQGRLALEAACVAAGLAGVEDVDQIIITHGHTDHFGCARWIQDRSGCRVMVHPLDREALDPEAWADVERALSVFGPLGMPPDVLRRFFARRPPPSWDPPADVVGVEDGAVLQMAGTSLRVLHRPGHTPGHLWVQEAASGAMFCGDHLLASSPTSAGMAADPDHPSGRRQLLASYNAALAELARMPVPVVFSSHGPPITDHADLIRRRLHKSHRRTDRVARKLAEIGERTAFDLAVELYGERIAGDPYEFLVDVAGRLDLLVTDGGVEAKRDNDGVWYYRARQEPSSVNGWDAHRH